MPLLECYSHQETSIAQDAMGWDDCHLHEFRLLDARNTLMTIGIPTDLTDPERPLAPSWDVV